MKWFALSCVAVLAGVASFAGVGPAGSASAVEAALWPRTVDVAFHMTTGVSLGKPTTLTSTKGVTSESHVDVGEKGAGFRLTWGNGFDRVTHFESWPILEGPAAKRTTYTVIAGIDFSQFSTGEKCRVVDLVGEEAGPFHCSMIQRGWDYDWDMYIVDDRVDRDLEVSASVRTEGSVSLEKGTFVQTPRIEGDASRHVKGATAVPTDSSTQLNSVHLREDSINRGVVREASAFFLYELFDNGKPITGRHGLPVEFSGIVTNKFASNGEVENESWCLISTGYIGNDLGYSCTVNAYYAKTGVDDRVHYVAEFTIRKYQ
jgi:hypothetical protein